MIRASVRFLLALVVPLVVAGCGGGGEGGPSGRSGRTLVVGVSNQPDRINPLVSTSAISTRIEDLVFLRLVDWGPPPELALEGRLAESWEVAPDRTSVTMHLRQDVVWSDGTPTTAEDVKFSFDRAAHPDVPFPAKGTIRLIEGVDVLDPWTVRFRYSEPAAEPLFLTRDPSIVPRHLLEDLPPERMIDAEFNRAPVGNGPWVIRDWQSEGRLVLEANERYHGERAGFDRLVLRFIPEDTTLRTELLTGGVHLYDRHPNKYYRQDSQIPELQFFRVSDRGYVYIGWNSRHELFGDVRVRKALTMATDRWTVIEAFRDGFGQVSAVPWYAEHPAYHSELEPLPFDPEAAGRLLDEAGWSERDKDGVRIKGGRRFEFTFMLIANNEISEEIATMVQDEYGKLGIAVDVDFLEWTVYVGRLGRKEFEATLLARVGDFIFDPEDSFHSRSIEGKYNDVSFGDAVTDSLIDLAKSIPDRVERNRIWWEFFEEFHERQPITVLYVSETSYPVRRDVVADARIDIRGPWIRLHEWHPVAR